MKNAVDMKQELGENPWQAFTSWYEKALNLDVNYPNWAVLSTTNNDNPNARIILLKGYNKDDGFVFYTNYLSPKSDEMAANNNACLLFFWDQLNYQIRIKGEVSKVSTATSQQYFSSRPRLSQIGAWSSKQSQVLKSTQELDDRIKKIEEKFSDQEIPCPPNWGGWQLAPYYFEFWRGKEGRLHERLAYSYQEAAWQSYMLYP